MSLYDLKANLDEYERSLGKFRKSKKIKPRIPKDLDFRIIEDFYCPQFGEPEDIEIQITLEHGYECFIDDLPGKEQAKYARKAAKFLLKYADWIEKAKK